MVVATWYKNIRSYTAERVNPMANWSRIMVAVDTLLEEIPGLQDEPHLETYGDEAEDQLDGLASVLLEARAADSAVCYLGRDRRHWWNRRH